MYRASNIERTGARDLTLSTFARHIPDVRHVDIDLMQVCPRCDQPEMVMEASSSADKSTVYLRRLAERAQVVAVLVRHQPHDLALERDVTVWAWRPETGYHPTRDRHVVAVHGAWFPDLLDYMVAIHNEHAAVCGGC